MEMSEKKPLLTRRVLYLSTDALRPNPPPAPAGL